MREWLPEGHLAYFIGDTVDSLDLHAFHARYVTAEWKLVCAALNLRRMCALQPC